MLTAVLRGDPGVVLGMLAYFAKLQREKISENTKSALARKKAQGVKLGQPSKVKQDRYSFWTCPLDKASRGALPPFLI